MPELVTKHRWHPTPLRNSPIIPVMLHLVPELVTDDKSSRLCNEVPPGAVCEPSQGAWNRVEPSFSLLLQRVGVWSRELEGCDSSSVHKKYRIQLSCLLLFAHLLHLLVGLPSAILGLDPEQRDSK